MAQAEPIRASIPSSHMVGWESGELIRPLQNSLEFYGWSSERVTVHCARIMLDAYGNIL